MTKRTSRWLFASGGATALTVLFCVTALAQTGGRRPAPTPTRRTTTLVAADAGAGKAGKVDGGAEALSTTTVGDGGAGDAGDGGADAAPEQGSTSLAAPIVRKASPPPPPPTPQQLAAYEALKGQVSAYESGAREYREAITDIIKLHYTQKKREILSDLDKAITYEKGALREAQQRAIASLERFILDYSGPRAHPESTPDAMYRLAALYEERARSEDSKEDLSVGLKPAIALYRRIIREFPAYRERAGVYYFLGHAYNDSMRTDEAQQVWRSLVCNNRYPYPTAPDAKRPEADSILPMPQDNKEAYWIEWRKRYPTPDTLKKSKGPDTSFIDPYPGDCQWLVQPGLDAGDEPKYVQEVWWRIGDWEFDQLDIASGVIRDQREPDLIALPSVYGYNRGATAYQHALGFKKPQVYGVALYKYAWTLFKQQRYEAATKEFVHLLNFADEQQKLTGDPGADYRAEAYTYIAGSLTTVDFKGPDADEPYIPRPDIVEESDTAVAEKKLRVAIDRVKDNNVIPQDRSWTIEIYKALAAEFRSLNQFNNAIEVYETMLKKWPMDPTAPDTQSAIAETYDQMNTVNNRPGTPEHDRVAAKALEARTALSNYIGLTPWVDANKENPQAIQNAERLVKGGLRTAAAQHTINARQALAEAAQSGDPKFQADRLGRALAEYRLAALGWQGYLRQDENAPDAYESRYWLADARYRAVTIGVALHKIQPDATPEPSAKEIVDARSAAIDVRDSNEDDKYLEPAAVMVVAIADVRRDLEYQRFEASGGSQGIEKVERLKLDNEGTENEKVVRQKIPDAVIDGILARDEYVQRVPPNLDVNKNALVYQFYSADTFFLYGQFEDAKARFEPLYKDQCTKSQYGYMAWERLITMSNKQRDVERSRQLAEAEKAHSCAMDDTQRNARDMIVNPTLQEAAYTKAAEKFKAAQAASPGPEKNKLWREAAGMYEAALNAAPARDEAPEAVLNGAYAYKQVGESNKAIELYNRFIAEYGSEALLTKLQKGDPKTKAAANPKKYEERVKYLGEAYDALSTTYYGFFNYQRAAETYDKIASNERFDEKRRRDASRNAILLYASMGQRAKMQDQARIYGKLKPNAEEKADVDFLLADYDYKQWNPQGADAGGNRDIRRAAEQAHMQFYNANRNNGAAAKYALESAWKVAKMKKVGGDPQYRAWLKSTITAWQAYDRVAKMRDGQKESQLAPAADYGAEADFTLVDEEAREKFDYETNHHRYAGAVDEIVGELDEKGNMKKPGKLQASVKDAKVFNDRLDNIAKVYRSVEYTPAVLARQGTLSDSIRTGLYEVRPPALKYFTTQQEAFLKQLESSGRPELEEKAGELRDQKKDYWRTKRDKELDALDELVVNRYVRAILLARQFSVRSPAVQRAVARLAYLTDVIGDAKMREQVEKVPDPTDPAGQRKVQYTDGMFIQARAGLTAVPNASGKAAPIPVSP